MALDKRNPHSLFRKSTALFLLISFLFTDSSSAILHADALQGSTTSRHGVNPADPETILGSLTLPEELGVVQEIFRPASQAPPQKLVLYLQDAHSNPDAQKNIRKIIHFLEEKYGLSLVLLEGGEGKLDSLLFRSYPAHALKEKMMEAYLREGELSGGETAAILEEHAAANYYGIESQELYQKNKAAFLQAMANHEKIQPQIENMRASLAADIQKASPPLQKFMGSFKGQNQSADLIFSRLKNLRGLYAGNPPFEKAFPEIYKILNAAQEAHTNKPLPQIQSTLLVQEMEMLEVSLRQNLPKSEEEKEILKRFRHFELLEKLSKLELSHRDWEELQRQNIVPDSLKEGLAPHQEFYELAKSRDFSLFENMNHLMETKKVRVAIVVTGGFHSEGIVEQLRETKTPFILMTPRIDAMGNPETYYRAVKGELPFRRAFKGTLWEALAQDYARKMAAATTDPFLLKEWRDRVIQNALSENRIAEAGIYTRYIDAAVNGREPAQSFDDFLNIYFDKIRTEGDRRLNAVEAGLRTIWDSGNFTPQTVETLFSQINHSHLGAELPLIRTPGNLFPASRFEVRDPSIPKVNSATEVTVSVKGLEPYFVGDGSELAKLFNSKLPDLRTSPGTIKFQGITFMQRRRGYRSDIFWTFPKRDLEKVAAAFEIPLSAWTKGLPQIKAGEVPVSATGIRKMFRGEPGKHLIDFRNWLSDPYWKGKNRINVEGVTFIRRKSANHVLWTFKKEDAPKVAEHFGWSLQPIVALTSPRKGEISVYSQEFSTLFIGNRQVFVKKFRSLLPDPVTYPEETVKRGGVTFYRRIDGPAMNWVFKKQDLKKVGKFANLIPARPVEELKEDEYSVAYKTFELLVENPTKFLKHMNDLLSNAKTSKQDTRTVGSVTFVRRKNGPWYVWAFKQTQMQALAKEQDFLLQGELERDIREAYGRKGDFSKVFDVTKLITKEDRMRGHISKLFPTPEGVWGDENLDMGIGKKLTRVEFVVIRKGDNLSAQFLGYRGNKQTGRSEARPKNLRGEISADEGRKNLIEYIKALIQKEDLSAAASRLKPFRITTNSDGAIYIGKVARSSVLNLNRPHVTVLFKPQLINPNDPSKGAYLILEIPKQNYKVYYDFHTEGTYFRNRPAPGIPEILDYIRVLKKGGNLAEVTRALKPFSKKMDKFNRLSLYKARDLGTALINLNEPEGTPVFIEPVWKNSTDASKGAYLKVTTNDGKVFYFEFKTDGNYFSGMGQPEVKAILDFLKAYTENKDLTEAAKSLKRFRMKPARMQPGSKRKKGARPQAVYYLGVLRDRQKVQISIAGLTMNDEIEVTPVLIDPGKKDYSKGVYLEVKIPDGSVLYYHFKKTPTYLHKAHLPGRQELLDYIKAYRKGMPIEKAFLDLKTFEMPVSSDGSINIGKVEKNYLRIFSKNYPGGTPAKFIPAAIDPEDLSKGIYIEIHFPDGEVFYYGIGKKKPMLVKRARPGAQQILEYLQALRNQEDLAKVSLALKPFSGKTSASSKIPIGTIPPRKGVSLSLNPKRVAAGSPYVVTPVLIDAKNPSRGSILKVESGKGFVQYFEFKKEYIFFEKIKAPDSERPQIIARIKSIYGRKGNFKEQLDITPLMTLMELRKGLIPEDFPTPGEGVWGGEDRDLKIGKQLTLVEMVISKEDDTLSVLFLGYRDGKQVGRNEVRRKKDAAIPDVKRGETAVSFFGLSEIAFVHKKRVAEIAKAFPNPKTSAEKEIQIQGITYFKRRKGPAFVWAFKTKHRYQFAGNYSLRLKGNYEDLKKGEIAVSVWYMKQLFKNGKENFELLQSQLPSIFGTKKNKISVKSIAFEKRMAGSVLVWAFKDADKIKVSQRFGFSDLPRMPAVKNKSGDVRIVFSSLSEEYIINPKKVKEIQRLLSHPDSLSQKTVSLKGVTFIQERVGGHTGWRIKKEDKAKFAAVFGLRRKEDIPEITDEIALSASERHLPSYVVGGYNHKKIDAIKAQLPDPKSFKENEFILKGITFLRRRALSYIVWTISKEDLPAFAKAFNFVLLKKLPGPQAGEIDVKEDDLRNHFLGKASDLAHKIKSVLPESYDQETFYWKGIPFSARQNHAKRYWGFPEKYKKEVAAAFNLRIRQKLPPVRKNEIEVTKRNMDKFFYAGQRYHKRLISYLPDLNDGGIVETEWQGVLFRKREGDKEPITWVFKKKDSRKLSEALRVRLREDVEKDFRAQVKKANGVKQAIRRAYRKEGDFHQRIDITALMTKTELLNGLMPVDFPLPGNKQWGTENREIVEGGKRFKRVLAEIQRKSGEIEINFYAYRAEGRDNKRKKPEKTPPPKKAAGLSNWVYSEEEGRFVMRSSQLNRQHTRKLSGYEKAVDVFSKYHVLDLAVSLSSNPDLMQQALAILLDQQGVEMSSEELGELSRSLILNLREGHQAPEGVTLEPGNPLDYLRGLMRLQEHVEKLDAYDQLVLIRAFTRLAFHDFSKNIEKSKKSLKQLLKSVNQEGFFGMLMREVENELEQGLAYQPSHIVTELKPHQRVGAWTMRSSDKLQADGIYGFLLEDDTRLGKTIQTFAAIDPSWKAAIIVPASVMDTWEEQYYEHTTGKMKLIPVRGSPERKQELVEEYRDQKGVILLFSVEDFQRKSQDQIDAISEGLDVMVIDEGQKIETYAGQEAKTSSYQAKAIHSIRTRRKWMLSASPYTSHPKQLFSAFHLIHTDPETGEVTDPVYQDRKTFNRLLTSNLKQMKWLYALKARIGLRRLKSEMGTQYSKKKEILPEEEGAYPITPEQAELTLQIIKNLGEYLKIYNARVPPEERFDQNSIGVLLKLLFLNLAITDPALVGENISTTYWAAMDRLVQKRLAQNKKGIIFAQNKKMIDNIIARYQAQGHKVARIDGTVDGYALDENGQEIRGFFVKGKLKLDSDGRRISSKSYQRHLFQEYPEIKLVVMNVRAGVGLNLNAADWVLYAQLPQNYVEYYQSSDRALGLNAGREQKEVEVLQMVATYPKSFLDAKKAAGDGAYVQYGTPAELLYKAIMGEDRQRFELVMEGMAAPENITERKAITRLVHAIHGFLEDPSMGAKSKKERKTIESAHGLYPIYQKIRGNESAEEEVLNLVDLYARTDVSPAALSHAIFKSKLFSPLDLKWITAVFQISNKLHRDEILSLLPEIFKQVWTKKWSMSELIERGPPVLSQMADLAPDMVFPLIATSHAWDMEEEEMDGLQPVHEGTRVLFQIIQQIQETGFALYEQRQWIRRFVTALIPLIHLESTEFLDFLSYTQAQFINGSLPLEEKIKIFEELAVLRQANPKLYEKILAMRRPFPEIQQALYDGMKNTFAELFDLPYSEAVGTQIVDLARKWGSLKAPVQMMAKLRAGGKDYEEHVALFKEAMVHILGGTFEAWRNQQAGMPTGHEIDYLKDNPQFWETFTREELVKFGDLTASQRDFKHLRQRKAEEILDLLEERGEFSLDQAFAGLAPEIRATLGDFMGGRNKLQTALRQAGTKREELAKKKGKEKELAAADQELKQLRAKLNVLELYEALNDKQIDSQQILKTLKAVRGTILEFSGVGEGEVFLENAIKDLEDNLEQLGKPRKFEEVEIEITSNPDLIMRRGMLDEELKNCFNLDYKVRQIATLVDDLASRNKMLAVVRSKGRIVSVAVLKIRKLENGKPVMMIERPLFRWGYNFEREIAQAVAITKSREMKDMAIVGDVYKGEEKVEQVDIYPTGARGPTEYHETLFGWRTRENAVHHIAGIIYKAVNDVTPEDENKDGISRVDFKINKKPAALLGIGHSSRSIGEFVALAKRAGIGTIVDVRTRPASQYHAQYNQEAFKNHLKEFGIDYVWLGDALGGKIPEFNDDFEAYMKANPGNRFQSGMEQLFQVVSQKPAESVSLLCSEGQVADCHRRFILDHIRSEARGPYRGQRNDLKHGPGVRALIAYVHALIERRDPTAEKIKLLKFEKSGIPVEMGKTKVFNFPMVRSRRGTIHGLEPFASSVVIPYEDVDGGIYLELKIPGRESNYYRIKIQDKLYVEPRLSPAFEAMKRYAAAVTEGKSKNAEKLKNDILKFEKKGIPMTASPRGLLIFPAIRRGWIVEIGGFKPNEKTVVFPAKDNDGTLYFKLQNKGGEPRYYEYANKKRYLAARRAPGDREAYEYAQALFTGRNEKEARKKLLAYTKKGYTKRVLGSGTIGFTELTSEKVNPRVSDVPKDTLATFFPKEDAAGNVYLEMHFTDGQIRRYQFMKALLYLVERYDPGIHELSEYAKKFWKDGKEDPAARKGLLHYEKKGFKVKTDKAGQVWFPKIGDARVTVGALTAETEYTVYPRVDLQGEIYLEFPVPGSKTRYYQLTASDKYLESRWQPGMEEIGQFAEAYFQEKETPALLERMLKYEKQGFELTVPDSGIVVFPSLKKGGRGATPVLQWLTPGSKIEIFPHQNKFGELHLEARLEDGSKRWAVFVRQERYLIWGNDPGLQDIVKYAQAIRGSRPAMRKKGESDGAQGVADYAQALGKKNQNEIAKFTERLLKLYGETGFEMQVSEIGKISFPSIGGRYPPHTSGLPPGEMVTIFPELDKENSFYLRMAVPGQEERYFGFLEDNFYLQRRPKPGMKEIRDYAVVFKQGGDQKRAREALLKYSESGIVIKTTVTGVVTLPKTDIVAMIPNFTRDTEVKLYPKVDIHGALYLQADDPQKPTRYFEFTNQRAKSYVKSRVMPGLQEITDYVTALITKKNVTQARERLLRYMEKGIEVTATSAGFFSFPTAQGGATAFSLMHFPPDQAFRIYPQVDRNGGIYLKFEIPGKETRYYDFVLGLPTRYLEVRPMQGMKEIRDYGEALIKNLRDIKTRRQKLLTYEAEGITVMSTPAGNLQFPKALEKGVNMSDFPKSVEVKIFPHEDLQKEIYLEVRAAGRRTRYHRFKNQDRYLEQRYAPGFEEIFHYARALVKGERNLTAAEKNLMKHEKEGFAVEGVPTGNFTFPKALGKAMMFINTPYAPGMRIYSRRRPFKKGLLLKMTIPGYPDRFFIFRKELKYLLRVAARDERDVERVLAERSQSPEEIRQWIRQQYENKEDFKVEINITPLISRADLKAGLISENFPLPEGKVWGPENRKMIEGGDGYRRVIAEISRTSGELEITFHGFRSENRSVAVETQLRDFYKSTGDSQVDIDLSPFLSVSDLKHGIFPRSFPLPAANVLGRSPRMKVGSKLTSVKAKGIRKNGTIYLILEGYQGEKKSGEFRWVVTAEGLEEDFHPIKKKLWKLYEIKKPFKKEIDLTPFLSKSDLRQGSLPHRFPLPGGNLLRRALHVKTGEKLHQLKAELIHEKGNFHYIFRGYRNKKLIKESQWVVSPEGLEEITHPTKKKLQQLYGRRDDFEEEIDLTSYLTKSNLRNGLLPYQFPLPGGSTVSKQQRMNIGIKLTSVKVIVIHKGNEFEFVFRGYKGEELKAEKRWKAIVKGLEEIPSADAEKEIKKSQIGGTIRTFYARKEDFTEKIDLTDYLSEKDLKEGKFPKRFPLPGGERLGEQRPMGVGINLSSVTGEWIRKDRKFELVLYGYKEGPRGREIHGKSRWLLSTKGMEKLPTAEEIEKIRIKKAFYAQVKRLYKKEGKFSERLNITPVLSKQELREGWVPEDFPLPSGKVWGPENREMIEGGKRFMRVEAEISRTSGELEITFRGFRSEAHSVSDLMDAVRQHAEAVLAGKSQKKTQAVLLAFRDQGFKVQASPKGLFGFPLVRGKGKYLQSLRPGQTIELFVREDIFNEIYFEIRVPKKETRYYQFTADGVMDYLSTRNPPGMEEIHAYASALIHGKDLRAAERNLLKWSETGFSVKVSAGGNLGFPGVIGRSLQQHFEKNAVLQIFPKKNFAGEVMIEIRAPGGKVSYFKFVKAANYLSSVHPPGIQEVKEYAHALYFGGDIKTTKANLLRYEKGIEAVASSKGNFQFPYIAKRSWNNIDFPPNAKIMIYPKEIKGGAVILEIHATGIEMRTFEIVKALRYVAARRVSKFPEIYDYVAAPAGSAKKKKAAKAMLAHKDTGFKTMVGTSGTIVFPFVGERKFSLGSVDPGSEAVFYPQDDGNGNLFLRMEASGKDPRYYWFVEGKTSYLEARPYLEPGVVEVVNYAKSLIRGKEDLEAKKRLLRYAEKGFSLTVPEHGYFHFPDIDGVPATVIKNMKPLSRLQVFPFQDADGLVNLEILVPGERTRYMRFSPGKVMYLNALQTSPGYREMENYAKALSTPANEAAARQRLFVYAKRGIRVFTFDNGVVRLPNFKGGLTRFDGLPLQSEILIFPKKDGKGKNFIDDSGLERTKAPNVYLEIQGASEEVMSYAFGYKLRVNRPVNLKPWQKAVLDYVSAFQAGTDLEKAGNELLAWSTQGVELVPSAKTGMVTFPRLSNENPTLVGYKGQKKVVIYPKKDIQGDIYLESHSPGKDVRYFRFDKTENYVKMRYAPGMQEIRDWARAWKTGKGRKEAKERLLKYEKEGFVAEATLSSGSLSFPTITPGKGFSINGNFKSKEKIQIFPHERPGGEMYLEFRRAEKSEPAYYSFFKKDRYLELGYAPGVEEIRAYVEALNKKKSIAQAEAALLHFRDSGITLDVRKGGAVAMPVVGSAKSTFIGTLPPETQITIYPKKDRDGELYLQVNVQGKKKRYYIFLPNESYYLKTRLAPGMKEIEEYAARLVLGLSTKEARQNLLRYQEEGFEIHNNESGMLFFPKLIRPGIKGRPVSFMDIPHAPGSRIYPITDATGRHFLLKMVIPGQPSAYYFTFRKDPRYLSKLQAQGDQEALLRLIEASNDKDAMYQWVRSQYAQTEDFKRVTFNLSSIMTAEDKEKGWVPAGFPVPQKSGAPQTWPADARDARAGTQLTELRAGIARVQGRIELSFVGIRQEMRPLISQKLFSARLSQDDFAAIVSELRRSQQEGKTLEAYIKEARENFRREMEELQPQVRTELIDASRANIEIAVPAVFEHHGLPIAPQEIAALIGILKASSGEIADPEQAARLRQLVDVLAKEKLIIEYRLDSRMAGETELQEMLKTALDFAAVSPGSEIRFLVPDVSQGKQLRKIFSRLSGTVVSAGRLKSLSKQIAILEAGQDFNAGLSFNDADLVITPQPQQALKDHADRLAFDTAVFENGRRTEKVTPAQFLSGSVAALLKDKIDGIVKRRDRLVRFADENAPAGLKLLMHIMAMEAESMMRMASAA